MQCHLTPSAIQPPKAAAAPVAQPGRRSRSHRTPGPRVQAATVEAAPSTDKAGIEQAVNAIRFLSIDAVNKANSGHPGMPMGVAPLAYVMFVEHMTHNPSNPQWFNRDRFVLSAGHGSMLQYSLMHFAGYQSVSVSPESCSRAVGWVAAGGVLSWRVLAQLEDCKQFRQLHSKTPGHPENFVTEGIEVTTGVRAADYAHMQHLFTHALRPSLRQVPWARASAMPSAWRALRPTWQRATTSRTRPRSWTTTRAPLCRFSWLLERRSFEQGDLVVVACCPSCEQSGVLRCSTVQVLDHGRRLQHGGRDQRGSLAGRPLGAWQAHRLLR